MITPVKFSVPFQQAPVVDYIATNIPSLFENKLVKVSNISPIQAGICRGLSNQFMMYESHGLGSLYIKKLSEAFNTISSQDNPKNILDKYVLNSIKKFKLAEFNALIYQTINEQVDYINLLELNNLSFDIHHLSIRDIYPLEDNVRYLNKLLKSGEIYERLNMPDTFLINYDFPANLAFFIEKLLDKNCSIRLNLSPEEIAPIREKLSHKLPLTMSDARLILAAFLKFEVDKISLISVGRQTRTGLINNNTQALKNRQNAHRYGELKTLADIEMDVDNSIKNKGYYYCLIETIDHCMAISAKNSDEKVMYTFFDPNNGILINEDSYHFFNQLSQIFGKFNTNGQTERSYAGHVLLNVHMIDKKANSQNRLSLPNFSNEEIQTNIKNALIKDKVKIALPGNFNIKLKNHNSINNITQSTIYKGLKKWNIDSSEIDVKKMISAITEKLPLIKDIKGNFSIDKYGEIYNR
ncbi:TPA: hypothetical protein VEO38_002266 [Providencia alcalifaciens]|nr:hypothetical protein [Providencia alcalifaciens]